MAENKSTKKVPDKKTNARANKGTPENKRAGFSFTIPEGMHRAMPIVLFAVAVFTGVCFIIGDIGTFGNFLCDLLLGLFSYAAYALPLLIALHAIFYNSDLKQKRILSRTVFSVVAISSISAAIYTVENWRLDVGFLGFEYYTLGTQHTGGGLVGGLIGYCLTHLFGFVGMIIIAAAVLAIYFTYFFSSGKSTLKRIGYRILKRTVIILAAGEKKIKHAFGVFGRAKNREIERKINEKNRELYEDDFFAVDNGIERLEITELGIKESRGREDIERKPHSQDNVFHKSEVSNASVKADPTHEGIYFFDDADIDGNVYSKSEDQKSPRKTETKYASEDSADDVFTKNFDPFDIAISGELRDKPSSKTKDGRHTVTETVSEITEADLERARREAEFERIKAELARKAQQREEEARRTEEFPFEKKAVEFTSSDSESADEPEIIDSFSATIDKNEEKAPVYSHTYTECWKCKVKNKLYGIKWRFKKKIKVLKTAMELHQIGPQWNWKKCYDMALKFER